MCFESATVNVALPIKLNRGKKRGQQTNKQTTTTKKTLICIARRNLLSSYVYIYIYIYKSTVSH